MSKSKQSAASRFWPEAAVALAGLLAVLFFATILQSWLAGRLSIWGDETGSIDPALRVWRGHKDFLWQLGQYNACPPGEPLMLRWFYRSDVLAWLREAGDGVYWRMSYILTYVATVLAAFTMVLAWQKRALIALFAALFVAVSPSVFNYGVEVRFYIWLVLFMTLASTLALMVFERPYREVEEPRPLYFVFMFVTTLGSFFHLMLVPVGYLGFAYSLVCIALAFYRIPKQKKTKAWASFGVKAFAVLFAGASTYIGYLVQEKHLIFIAPPWKGIDPWQKLFETSPSFFIERISSSLPFPSFWQKGGLIVLLLSLAATGLRHLVARNWGKATQAGFLLVMIPGSLIALFLSGAARNYPINVSHCIYQAPLVALALVYLFNELRALGPLPAAAKPLAVPVLTCLLALAGIALIADRAYQIKDKSPAKENFSFHAWREYYRHVPDKKKLVVVGGLPDQPFGDVDGYLAGILEYYTKEFNPLYLSKKGLASFSQGELIRMKQMPELAKTAHDYLLIGCERLKPFMPQLPWTEFTCFRYPDGRLCHCRK